MKIIDFLWPSYRFSKVLSSANLSKIKQNAKSKDLKIVTENDDEVIFRIPARRVLGPTTASFGQIRICIRRKNGGVRFIGSHPGRRAFAFIVSSIGIVGSLAAMVKNNSFESGQIILLGSIAAPYLDSLVFLIQGTGSLKALAADIDE